MNLLIYLVYGREKTFDMQSMKAFKFLNAYNFLMALLGMYGYMNAQEPVTLI